LDTIDQHIADHLSTVRALQSQRSVIAAISQKMIECLARGGRIFWLGNGGSAADCQHLAAELVGRFERERKGLASIALTTDTSVLTAIANDCGFDQVFARQVDALCRPGDLVIGISTSGNSKNVLEAIRTAASKGIRTVGLSGRDGGKLKADAEICLVVASDNTARIQEAHILIGHILCDLAERRAAECGALDADG
jgi:D-sedoheptulose 7-phosphate isomerase